MKVIVITDSMSMPRANIMYEDTWYYKIKNKLKVTTLLIKNLEDQCQ